MKKALAGGVAALGIAGGSLIFGVVPAIAQDDSDGPDTVLDELVTEGVISQDQADTVEERFQEWRETRTDRGGRGFGGRGLGGIHGDAETRQEILDLLDIDDETLRERLMNGETMADIAGDDLDAVVDLLVDSAEERLAEAVENGRITQEEADEKAADLDTRIEEKLESSPSFRGGRGHRGGFGRHFGEGDQLETPDDGALEDSSLTSS